MAFGKMLIGFFFGLTLLSVLVAASPDTASITIGSTGNSRYNTTTGGTQAVIAGSVYNLNLNAQSSTNYWAGAFGNVSGAVQLRNTAGKDLFTLNLVSGLPQESPVQNIYTDVSAVNSSTIPNMSSIAYMTGANFDSMLGVAAGLTDSATNLFTNTAPTAIVGNKTITSLSNAAFCPVSYNATSGTKILTDCTYPTMIANDSFSNLLFVTPARPIVWSGGASEKLFDNASYANYQMLLFANNSGTSAATTYSFYLELR